MGRLGCLLMALWLGAAAPALAEQISLQTRPGVTQVVQFTAAATPVRSVILFTGSGGGAAGMGNNFLMRIADRLAAAGINVAVPELPSDTPGGMPDGFRAGPDHATDMAAVIALLRKRAAVPVWLVGTSRGTLSAANVAVRLGPQQVAGLVLTSTIWPTVTALVPLDQVQVPTLVMHNRLDGCRQSPPSGAEPGLAALRRAPVKELVVVSGGVARSGPCEALSPHGYYGIEDQVVVPMIRTH